MTTFRAHPLRTAEAKLRELGIEHAPIQGFLEGDAADGRYIGPWDDPGVYYLLGGVYNAGTVKEPNPNRNKINLLYLQCPENAHQVAEQLGWVVEKIEQLPSFKPIDVTILSAILVRPS